MGFVIAGTILATGSLWASRLILAPGLFADSSGAVLGLDLLAVSAVAAVGMILSRGRWSRNLGWFLVAAELGLLTVMAFDGWAWVALAATGTTLVLLSGPWPKRFLRQLPPAAAPAVIVVYLAIGLLLVPGLVAVANPAGMGAVHWVAAGVGVASGWAFSRALVVGLWAVRVVVPGVLIAAAVASPLFGGLALAVASVAILLLAWSRAAGLAVHALVSATTGVAVPPELVPAELLAAAGYDERGRKREELE